MWYKEPCQKCRQVLTKELHLEKDFWCKWTSILAARNEQLVFNFILKLTGPTSFRRREGRWRPNGGFSFRGSVEKFDTVPKQCRTKGSGRLVSRLEISSLSYVTLSYVTH